ncbi:MAG: glycosyltransferase family 2 protein [Nakamurella sp.]
MSGPTVSVVICAYTMQRWADLVAAVSSAADQPETSEVVVVIDHEPKLLARARAQWENLQIVSNVYRQGLSGARNTGLEATSGEIVAFLDDDAVARPDWLAAMLGYFEITEVVAVGGKAEPVWPGDTVPATLPPELLWVVGCTYLGQPTSHADVRNVLGCSMSFRRAALIEVGGFNLDTGRVGNVPLGCEETDVCIRLRQADPRRRIIFAPDSVVSHRVTPDRLTWRYLRRRSFFEGISKAVLGKELGARDALSTERAYVRSVLPRGFVRELRGLRPLRATAIVVSLTSAGFGYVYGSVRTRFADAGKRPAPVRVSQ